MPFSPARSDLHSLEAAVISAGRGFACVFSSSDEYERALIAQRRADGRYDHIGRQRRWPWLVFAGACLAVLLIVTSAALGR